MGDTAFAFLLHVGDNRGRHALGNMQGLIFFALHDPRRHHLSTPLTGCRRKNLFGVFLAEGVDGLR